MFVIETDAVAIKESLVVQVLGDHGMDETCDQGGIGAGPNRDPLVSHSNDSFRVARVDDYRAYTRGLACLLGNEHLAAA